MHMRRRDLLLAGSALGLSSVLAQPRQKAWAQEKYPSRTIRFIVPTAAGGVYDLMGRLLADRIGPPLGTMIVENRAGGNATVGVSAAAKSAPDGYTILLGSNSTHIFQPTMMRNPPYDPVKDFVPIATLSASWTCVAVSPSLGISTLKELVDYAKANPGKLTHGIRGIGDVSHMGAELFKQLTGKPTLLNVPYSAMATAVKDLMSGDLKMTIPLTTATLVELHNTGKIRLLSINAPRRLSFAQNIPTAEEAGLPGMLAAEYFYVFAPAGTPVPILQRLNDEVRAALENKAFQERLTKVGFDPIFAGGLAESKGQFEKERARWIPIAEATGQKI
jgi:tripartite-type tricarboxylate transporter receptor subunit TctC